MVSRSLKAAELLENQGIKAWVVNMRFVSPLDTAILEQAFNSGKEIFTVEENVIDGGFGSAVAEYLTTKGCSAKLSLIGIPGEFGIQAPRERLLEIYGLTPEAIAEKVRKGILR